jgi:hypothetical protein
MCIGNWQINSVHPQFGESERERGYWYCCIVMHIQLQVLKVGWERHMSPCSHISIDMSDLGKLWIGYVKLEPKESFCSVCSKLSIVVS